MKGQLKHFKKLLAIRGLNANHDHNLQECGDSRAAVGGLFQEFYATFVVREMKPAMVRLIGHARSRAICRPGIESEHHACRRTLACHF